jgi:DNA topoisomerase-1
VTRLRRVNSAQPGYARRRHGRGFSYVNTRGARIGDEAVLARIRGLAIPPAWTDVWICPDESGHLQAAGTDAAGRRQYLYHQEWRRRRDRGKFARIERFAEELPALRRTVATDLRGNELSRPRVLACAVRMLDRGLFRIGTEDYAAKNGSFGLATLKKVHVHVRRDRAEFDFVAKAGVRQVREVEDADILPVLRSLTRRRGGGDELLAYREDGAWIDVRSSDINAYLKAAAGEDFSAKDFRTWHATVFAALGFASQTMPTSATAQRRAVAGVIGEVAAQLGNTPAVCRASYVDPRVIDRFAEGIVIDPPAGRSDAALQRELEVRVLRLLRGEGRGLRTVPDPPDDAAGAGRARAAAA